MGVCAFLLAPLTALEEYLKQALAGLCAEVLEQLGCERPSYLLEGHDLMQWLELRGPFAAGGLEAKIVITVVQRRKATDWGWQGLCLQRALVYTFLTRASLRNYWVIEDMRHEWVPDTKRNIRGNQLWRKVVATAEQVLRTQWKEEQSIWVTGVEHEPWLLHNALYRDMLGLPGNHLRVFQSAAQARFCRFLATYGLVSNKQDCECLRYTCQKCPRDSFETLCKQAKAYQSCVWSGPQERADDAPLRGHIFGDLRLWQNLLQAASPTEKVPERPSQRQPP